MTHPFFHHTPMVMSHRGNQGQVPENTIESFLSAAEFGTHCIESDLHLSRDNHIVMIHDPAVDRTTNGSGSIGQFNLEEISSLDAGYRFSNDGGSTFPFRDKGLRIPTLQQALEALPEMRFCLDLKQKDPRLVIELCSVIEQMDVLDRVLCASTHDSNLRMIRQRLPDAATGCGSNEALATAALAMAGLLFMKKRPAGLVLQVPPVLGPLPLLTPGMVRQYHQAGLYVHTWTINDEQAMEELLESEVDGIVTDNTELLLKLIKEHLSS